MKSAFLSSFSRSETQIYFYVMNDSALMYRDFVGLAGNIK